MQRLVIVNGEHNKHSVVVGSQLLRAREMLHLSAEEVAQELRVSGSDILDWERETSQPALGQLETLAALYGRGIDYFLKRTPDPPTHIAFRGKPGQSLKDLAKETKLVLAKFDELCRTAFELDGLLERKQEISIPRFEIDKPTKDAVKAVRSILGVREGPLTELRTLLEGLGARIFELRVDPLDAFSGFSYWHADYGPCVLLNARDNKGRKNFTLAHELAHLVYGHGSSLCSVQPGPGHPPGRPEQKANRFSAELLLPDTAVGYDFERRELPRSPSARQLSNMASKWGVSVQALGYRLEDLQLIRAGHTTELQETRPPHLRPSKTPSWERQRGKRFVKTSLEAYRQHVISIGKLADALGIPIRTALEIAEKG